MFDIDLNERLNFSEHQVAQFRAKPGKVVRRLFPEATGDEVEALSRYFTEGLSLTISGERANFVEAYKAVTSCMTPYGAECWEAYSKVGIKVATLRNRDGVIVSRSLVRTTGLVALSPGAYGTGWYVMQAVMRHLCSVKITDAWLEGVDLREIHTIKRNQVLYSVRVPVRETRTYDRPQLVWDSLWKRYERLLTVDVIVGYRNVEIKGEKIFRPYLDGSY